MGIKNGIKERYEARKKEIEGRPPIFQVRLHQKLPLQGRVKKFTIFPDSPFAYASNKPSANGACYISATTMWRSINGLRKPSVEEFVCIRNTLALCILSCMMLCIRQHNRCSHLLIQRELIPALEQCKHGKVKWGIK